ncbi:hypothetical protein EDD79_100515 [Serpentinicella alkaliphila]|uniref:Uncharacterized protein n=1 Tax=Serpentinicella alkaliphila TaxID=1734049 RepID=A0A4R2TN49_9FIRM|nr:hypothetical protein EDD79_100515 [Serpentinicella alkaliphila]
MNTITIKFKITKHLEYFLNVIFFCPYYILSIIEKIKNTSGGADNEHIRREFKAS